MQGFSTPIPFGPYFLHAKIADGGMAEVLLATTEQPELQGQFLALKKLLPHLNANKPFVDLLIHEAKIGVLLSHPLIVPVYDLGSYKSEFFLTMDYVHGKSLDHLLSLIQQKKIPPLGVELSTYLVGEILRALTFAHELKDIKGRELNIIHRDISPGNILISYLGDVKLADFGIATAENRLQSGFTQTALGKIAYVSPEQATNEPATKTSDIYSLGVVYYQLLTGKLPYSGQSVQEILKKVLEGQTESIQKNLASIPTGLRELLLKCLDRDASERPSSCPFAYQALKDALLVDFKVDLAARASRQYFKKKLSETMRRAFKQEIENELQIIQSALKSPIKAPTTSASPPTFQNSSDATIVFEDYADESTRFYPATADDQKKELANLPPTDATIDLGQFDKIWKEETQPSSPSLRSLKLERKLQLSNLQKDQKDLLTDQKPDVEITSEAELEAFEEISLITIVPEQIKSPRASTPAFLNEDTSPDRTPSKSKTFAPSMSKSAAYLLEKLPWIVGFIFIAVSGWLIQSQVSDESSAPKQTWGQPKKIFLQFLGEVPLASQQLLITALKDASITPNLRQVEDLFNREFKRYSQTSQDILQFELNAYPTTVYDGLSRQPNVQELFTTEKIFTFLNERLPNAPTTGLPTIYIYFYPAKNESDKSKPQAEEYLGARRPDKGVVFAEAHPSMRLKILLLLAREVARLFGATDKFMRQSAYPAYPRGFAEPHKSPLYPQDKAELMGMMIALSPTQAKSIQNLGQLLIGTQTAFEMGWIDKTKI